MAGLYRYGLGSKTLARVIPLSALDAATFFSAQQNVPLLLMGALDFEWGR